MLLSQKGYVTVAKGVCYCRKRGMLLSQKIILENFETPKKPLIYKAFSAFSALWKTGLKNPELSVLSVLLAPSPFLGWGWAYDIIYPVKEEARPTH